ncbi:YVTN family beta-propeller protein [Pseudomonas marginalis]|uniref:YncE family protein n=1 Tax=Pseudomonas marginalis TaxID=298 RepID=UPI0020A05587|nr:YncE family protein [Pseudomonas marginalis]MCP1505341.1 YVTN family beta-propeller protein [Pseudomonas marginalis]MCP1522845.1 YVTN family beta-propeller protein [Pseudomonas marginalis]MDQ0497837.1 YVTN family beta-propeller protein [Pseudomonas marginalis]
MPNVPNAPFQSEYDCQCPEIVPISVPTPGPTPRPSPETGNIYEFDLENPEVRTPIPFSDLVLDIPGLRQPYIGYDGAINESAKNLNPEKGLLCILRPYLLMQEFDFIELFFGKSEIPADSTTVTDIQADRGLSIPLYVSQAWLDYGAVAPCFFRVTRAGGGTDETAHFRFFVDDFKPGGPDPDQDLSYNQNVDAPQFEQHIIDDGVTDEDAGTGVAVSINRYPNRTGLSPRYNWAARDVIWLLLNGHVVKHSVTEGEAAGTEPIVIMVYNSTWINVGYGDIVSQYFVIDEAGNRMDGASPVTIIQSLIGNPHPLLDKPFIAEVDDNGRVDINLLEGEPATLVINVPGKDYLKFDEIKVRAEGHTAGGSVVVKEYFGTINSIFVNLHITIPFADLQEVVGGSWRVRFERVRTGVTPNRRSRVNVLEVIGNSTPVELPPAYILQAPDGNIPAESLNVTIKINAYTGQDYFDAVLVHLIGTYPTGGNYYRPIGPRPAGDGNITFNITNGPNGEIAQLEGGTLDVSYEVTNSEGTRHSQIANFNVGNLVESMPIVRIEEAPPPDHVFNPEVSHFGATIIVPRNAAFVAGSTITLYFEGSAAGGSYNKPFPMTDLWLNQDLYFDVPRTIVLANLNYSAKIYYILKKDGQRDRLSFPVDMRVGAPLNLDVPEILEATVIVPGQSATINPTHVLNPPVFTLRVRYDMLNTDLIKPYFRGPSGAGTPSISPKSGNANAGFVDFQVTNSAIAATLNQHAQVGYTVERASSTIPSNILDLEVQPLPDASVDVVSVPEAVENQFDTHTNNTVRILGYPFMSSGQSLWIALDGENDTELADGRRVTIAEANAKEINEPIPLDYQLPLSAGTTLDVKVRVSLDGTNLFNTATELKIPRYIVKRETGVIKEITVGTSPHHIALSADGARAYVTNYTSHTVSVINTRTNTVIDTISGFSNPYRLAIHPDGARLFVGNLGTKTASVVNLATNTIIQTITGFNRIFGIAFNEDGTKVYLSCNYDAFVYVHNAQTGARLNSLKVIYPTGLAFNPEYTRLYAPSQSVITMINPVGNGSLIGDIPGTSYPRDIATSPHNFHAPKAYITNRGLNNAGTTVLVLNMVTNTISKILTGFNAPNGVAMNPITERAYISEATGNRVHIIDTSTDTVISSISGFNAPEGIGVSKNGAFAYVCNSGSNKVSVIAL